MPGAVAWGRRMYGKVDRVGKVLFVATPCSHFCFLPFIPHGSMIVLGKKRNVHEGVRIRLSWKSWLVGWIQALLTGLLVLLGVMLASILSLYFWGEHVDQSNTRWTAIW